MNETELQKILYETLKNNNYRVYSDKQYPSIKWYPKTFSGIKKPNLLLFHDNQHIKLCDV